MRALSCREVRTQPRQHNFCNDNNVHICCLIDNDLPQKGITFKALVNHYKVHHKPCLHSELGFYEGQSCLSRTVVLAALAVTSQATKHPHQWRVPNEVLADAASHLSHSIEEMKQCREKGFDALLSFVAEKTKCIGGIGELTVYDIALRISAKLGIQPQVVYLHAGTKEGAKALEIATKSVKFIEPKWLPNPLKELEPMEVEDFLCIYKGMLPEV